MSSEFLTEYTKAKQSWSIFDHPLGQPWYLLNFLVIATFPILRFTHLHGLDDLPVEFAGLNKESILYLAFFFFLSTRYRMSASLEAFVVYAITYARVLILLLCYYGYPRAVGWYAIAFISIALVLKNRIPGRSSHIPSNSHSSNKLKYLTPSQFVDKVEKDKSGVYFAVLVIQKSNTECMLYEPIFAKLKTKYSSANLLFEIVNLTDSDVTSNNENTTNRGNNINNNITDSSTNTHASPVTAQSLASKYSLNISYLSRQLPSIILFRQGHIVKEKPGDHGGRKIEGMKIEGGKIEMRLPPKGENVNRTMMTLENIANALKLESRR